MMLIYLKRTRSLFFLPGWFAALAACVCLLSLSAQAQVIVTDSVNQNDGDSSNEALPVDTSSYYFTWKENTAEPYVKSQIQGHANADSLISKWKAEDEFWYVNSIEQFQRSALRFRTDRNYRDSLREAGLLPPDEQVFTQEENGNAWYMQPWFRNVIWTVILLIFLTSVVYFLLANKINLFSRSSARTNIESPAEEDLFSINYNEALQKYESDKAYRFAVRILYLQLLRQLSDKQIIHYQPNHTDAHYLQQLYNTRWYHSFFEVTRYYEYVWYGEFQVEEERYQTIRQEFEQLKKEVSAA